MVGSCETSSDRSNMLWPAREVVIRQFLTGFADPAPQVPYVAVELRQALFVRTVTAESGAMTVKSFKSLMMLINSRQILYDMWDARCPHGANGVRGGHVRSSTRDELRAVVQMNRSQSHGETCSSIFDQDRCCGSVRCSTRSVGNRRSRQASSPP